MILGMSVATFTLLHVIISLVAILAGFVVVFAMLRNGTTPGWTALFLATTVLTSVTGFMFPLKAVGPPHIFGAISLVALALALYALYGRKLAGSWRWLYIATALLTFYLNVVVAVVQAFQKIGPLHELAPKQQEPPFLAAQLLVLALFIAFAVLAGRRFHPAALHAPG
jgi:hypothetical protein